MKYLWLAAGFLFLGIGVLGVFLPLLPTTPFILVTIFCFAKGSDRLHRWLLSTKLYQNHVKNFHETRSMTLKAKVSILACASAMLITAFYFSNHIHARIAIITVLCIKYYVFIFKIKTVSDADRKHTQETPPTPSDQQS